MKYIRMLSAMLLILCGLPSASPADIIPSGQKYVRHCFSISNIEEYPDFTLIMYGNYRAQFRIIRTAECTSGYKYGSAIYAIRTTKFGASEFWRSDEERIRSGISQNKSAIPSNLDVNSADGIVPDQWPITEINDVLEIVSLREDVLEMRFAKVIYTYHDGTVEEIPFMGEAAKTGERPQPSRVSELNQDISDKTVVFANRIKDSLRVELESALRDRLLSERAETPPLSMRFYLMISFICGTIIIAGILFRRW